MNTDSSARPELEQVVDWRAAVVAGLVAGTLFLAFEMVVRTIAIGGTIWIVPRYIAAMVLGESVLPPPGSFDPLVVLVALVINTALSLFFALILAAVIHEWSLPVGIVVGGLFGLALYLINYYTFSYFFPWFYPIRSWIDVAAHVLFGATAGGVYELLETERFVRDGSQPF